MLTTNKNVRNRSKRYLAVLVALLVAALSAPLLLVLGALWLASETHRFGFYDPRYLLLVHGTTVQRLGLLPSRRGSVAYAARGQDGNSPAHVHVSFQASDTPAKVLEHYNARCRKLGLLPQRKRDAKGSEFLECNGPGGDEIGIIADRQGEVTVIQIGGWVF